MNTSTSGLWAFAGAFLFVILAWKLATHRIWYILIAVVLAFYGLTQSSTGTSSPSVTDNSVSGQ